MSFTKQQTPEQLIYHTADGISSLGGVVHGFATRLGGVSPAPWATLNLSRTRGDAPENVRENYRRFCQAIGAHADKVVLTSQVHQDTVRVVTQKDILADLYDPIPYDADGLVTNVPGLALTVFYADCLPILLYDPRRNVIGAVHAGWRGTQLGIVERAVATMGKEFGCQVEDIHAAIGPGIEPCCFETHSDVPKAMWDALGSAIIPYVQERAKGKYFVDLKGINAYRLERVGIPHTNVDILPLCTACNPQYYWSHRRLGEQRGNQGAIIQLIDAG